MHFGELLRRQRRRAGVDLGDDADELVLHLLPVGDRHAHVFQHARDVGGERRQARRIRQPVDLDVDERFPYRVRRVGRRDVGEDRVLAAQHRDDRMDDEVQREAVAIDFHRHRVDEERHVVVDDLDDGVRRLPAVLLDRRIEHAHAGVARLALPREAPVRKRGTVEIGGRPLGEVLRIDLPEIADDEALEHVALDRRRPGTHQSEHGIELPCPAVVRMGVHRRLQAFAVAILPRSALTRYRYGCRAPDGHRSGFRRPRR